MDIPEDPIPTVMVSVRMPQDLRELLIRRARQNHRTLTGELLHLVEAALAQEPPPRAEAPRRA